MTFADTDLHVVPWQVKLVSSCARDTIWTLNKLSLSYVISLFVKGFSNPFPADVTCEGK